MGWGQAIEEWIWQSNEHKGSIQITENLARSGRKNSSEWPQFKSLTESRNDPKRKAQQSMGKSELLFYSRRLQKDLKLDTDRHRFM